MIYIENVFVCIAAPLFIVSLCLGKGSVRFCLLCLAGMGACLLSAYLNAFFASILMADDLHAVVEITPVVEETVKLLPLLFYFFVFEPKPEHIRPAVLTVAAGFATFENICYLIQNGSGHLGLLVIRGFSTGAMHIICGAIVASGLVYVWQRAWLKLAGICGLLSAAIIFHAVYNLLIAAGGAMQMVAYLLPLTAMLTGFAFRRLLRTAL